MTRFAGSATVDVVIVGGGLVGAALAVALAESRWRVLLVEAHVAPVTAPAWDERCIALNDASRRVFAAWRVWPSLHAEAAPILATHISERGRFGVARFSAAEAGLDALGFNVPLRAIGAALLGRLQAAPAVQVLQPATVAGIELGDAQVELAIDAAGARSRVQTRLLVAADGANSTVRALLGIDYAARDYAQHAIVSAVRLPRPHRGIAYERFTPDGPLALIPKPDHAASLVWTQPSAAVEARLALSDVDYLAAAQEAFGGRLGRFVALGRRMAWPLSRVMTAQLTAPRTVFIGNAAQSLHPVAAQGFNLGLRDVAALTRRLRDSATADPGDGALLAAHAAERRLDRERVSGFTDLLVQAFSNRLPGLAQARHWGLLGADLLPPVRQALLRQHLGYLGLSPAGLQTTSMNEDAEA